MKNFLSYLLSLESKGIKLGLERTYDILNACDNPQNHIKTIQVVGTNGKGSTSAIIANIFKQANYKVGLYTSPHLKKINERIRINGVSISDDDIIQFVTSYQNDINSLNISFFEAMTALALWYFKNNNVDIAILETGLGGRLDSVTACKPELVVFTPISLDHQHILGETIEEITQEKAGAMKKNIPCISAPQVQLAQKILNEHASKLNTTIDYINYEINDHLNLNGIHQKINAALAISSITYLKQFHINDSHISKALETISWPARIQKISTKPLTFFDVAHNETSFLYLCEFVNSLKIKDQKILILAIQQHKHFYSALKKIESTFDLIILTQTNTRNFLSAQDLDQKLYKKNTRIINNPEEAISTYKDSNAGCIVIAGSHYLGPVISRIFKISFEKI